MSEGLEDRKTFRAKVQRTPAGAVLGACLMIGADDLTFVDSTTEWLTIETKPSGDGLILTIRAV